MHVQRRSQTDGARRPAGLSGHSTRHTANAAGGVPSSFRRKNVCLRRRRSGVICLGCRTRLLCLFKRARYYYRQLFKTQKAEAKRSAYSGGTVAGEKCKLYPFEFCAFLTQSVQLPNDALNLRQPVRNTALTYLSNPSQPSQQLLVGTQLGDVRRYDTRAARRPVSNWTGLAKAGGVGVIEKGTTDQ